MIQYFHAPKNYECPICLAVNGIENDKTWIKQIDIFFQDDVVTGFISSKFIKGNEGHAIIVPNQHYENIYDIPNNVLHRIIEIGKITAAALKETRKCDGINFIQNNEPAADQHAFHYHLHVIPRFKDDNFHTEYLNAEKSEPKDRVEYTQLLKDYFTNLNK